MEIALRIYSADNILVFDHRGICVFMHSANSTRAAILEDVRERMAECLDKVIVGGAADIQLALILNEGGAQRFELGKTSGEMEAAFSRVCVFLKQQGHAGLCALFEQLPLPAASQPTP